MSRRQKPIWVVITKYGELPPIKKLSSEFVEEHDDVGYSIKTTPLNRQAFKISMKRQSMKAGSKKAGTRKLANDKEQRRVSETNRKKEAKRRQSFKRLAKRLAFDTTGKSPEQIEQEAATKYPKVYKKLKQLVRSQL